MGTASYTLGPTPTVSINRCAGDLTIDGQAGETVTLVAGTMPHSTQDGDRLVVDRCDDDLQLYVPRDATVSGGRVDGDAQAGRLAGLQLDEVSGDLDLQSIGGPCTVRRVAGDLHGADLAGISADRLSGDVRLDRVSGAVSLGRAEGDLTLVDVADVMLGAVSGDLHLDRAQGRLALEQVEGDAEVRGTVGGFGPAHVGGDLTLHTPFARGQGYQLTVGGDAVIYIPENADLTLSARVEGDVSGLPGGARDGEVSTTWGEGSATLTLTVGGDLQIRRAPAAAGMDALTSRGAAATPIPAATAPQEAAPGVQGDPMLTVLEAVARGELSPAEADDLLSTR